MSLRNMAEVAALILLICINPGDLFPQRSVRLTLSEAKTMALNNHPQILAAQNEAAYTNEQITVSRAPYFSTFSADITGTQGNELARMGVGVFYASCLCNRFGLWMVFVQLESGS